MKSVLKILLAAVLLVTCLTACSNIPDEPAVTTVEKHTYHDPYGQTAPVAENIKDYPGMTQPVYYFKTTHEIECVLSSYFVYGNTVAEITDVDFDYEGTGFSMFVNGRADVKIIAKGMRDDEMRIGYTAYDADGKKLDTSSIVFNIEELKKGDVWEDTIVIIPDSAAKIVFHDYEE